MKVLCVIPARYASTRLPGKPLSLIAGKPMIQHVYERACQAKLPDEVVVATDNELVKKAVDGFGGKAMMTSPDHPSGTDRLAEVRALGDDDAGREADEQAECVRRVQGPASGSVSAGGVLRESVTTTVLPQ